MARAELPKHVIDGSMVSIHPTACITSVGVAIRQSKRGGDTTFPQTNLPNDPCYTIRKTTDRIPRVNSWQIDLSSDFLCRMLHYAMAHRNGIEVYSEEGSWCASSFCIFTISTLIFLCGIQLEKRRKNTLRFGRDSFSLLFNRIGVWVVRKCSNRGRNAVWKGYSTILWEGCFIVDAAIGEWCTVCCY